MLVLEFCKVIFSLLLLRLCPVKFSSPPEPAEEHLTDEPALIPPALMEPGTHRGDATSHTRQAGVHNHANTASIVNSACVGGRNPYTPTGVIV